MPADIPNKAARGFTLAELIVATTLMAIVMTTVYTVFHTAIQTWRVADAGYAPYRDARLAMQMLDRDLRSVPQHAMHLFQGTEDRLEFVTLTAPMNVEDDPAPRMMLVEYRLTAGRGPEGRRLIREEAPIQGPLPGVNREVRAGLISTGRDKDFVIAEGVKEFELTYRWAPPHRRTDSPAELELIQTSAAHAALPRAIGIRLRFADTDTLGSGLEVSALVVPRGQTSPVPEAVLDQWRRQRGGL